MGNGADPTTATAATAALRAAAAAGIEVCFANPGTTEMDWVRSLDQVPEIRPVLGLFEGVCTGAADGYARITGRPAMTLTHLGPGFANGIANLHNARRAHSPVVNIVGDHASWHLVADAPLTSDIESLARPVSEWVGRSSSPESLAAELVAVIDASEGRTPDTRRGPATLIVPQDHAWSSVTSPGTPDRMPERRPSPDPDRIGEAARRLVAASTYGAVLVGGTGLSGAGLRVGSAVTAETGATWWSETFPARHDRGAGRPSPTPIPYFPDQATAALERCGLMVLAGAPSPVAFFGYPDGPSSLLPEDCEIIDLCAGGVDPAEALTALADALGAATPPVEDLGRDPAPVGSDPLDHRSLGAVLAAVQPDGCIVVHEAATSALPWMAASAGAPPHTMLQLTGGAIGFGLPTAVGAAIAAPDRKVVAFQADGSAMYTLQSLWTMARENLDVTIVVCANQRYRILQVELARAGVTSPGQAANRLTDLSSPHLDWVSLATGLGLPARRATTIDEARVAIEAGLSFGGPNLIEAILS